VPLTAVYINQVNLFLLFFFKRNITHPIFELMCPGRGFKINNNSAMLSSNVKVFTSVKVESLSFNIGSPVKKWGCNHLISASLAKSGAIII
jgi:hypothetical protein